MQVLRPPAAKAGKASFRGALSVDGRLVATGAFSAQTDIYVFQRRSGWLVHGITGWPNVITHLAFTRTARSW